jgi:hypothetical protein
MVFGVGVGVAVYLIFKNLLLICGLYYLMGLISNFITEELKVKTDKLKKQTKKLI